MKARDTIMRGKTILQITKNQEMGCSGVPLYLERLVEAQAEISFKAGYDKGKQENLMGIDKVKKILMGKFVVTASRGMPEKVYLSDTDVVNILSAISNLYCAPPNEE